MNYSYINATISVVKYYVSNNNQKSVELINFEFYGDLGEIHGLFNSETYAIYTLDAINYNTEDYDTYVDITDEYYKYLNVEKKQTNDDYSVYYSNDSISLYTPDVVEYIPLYEEK